LITKTFPHEGGETPFLSPEFPYLCENFDVTVVTTQLTDAAQQQTSADAAAQTSSARQAGATVPDDMPCVTEINISPASTLPEKIMALLLFLCHRDAWREIAAIIRSGHDRLPQLFRALMFGTAAENFYGRLKKKTKLSIETDAIFYFYWADYKCFGLTMHRRKYPHINVVARTHGYELYDERELYGRQFFKPQMDEGLDRLIFVSAYGKQYYLEKYHKADSVKYPLHRLGIRRASMPPQTESAACPGGSDSKEAGESAETRNESDRSVTSRNASFVLASCSNVVDIKRIDLIIEGLSLVGENVRWVHIGDGPLRQQLEEKAKALLGQKQNITCEWKGAMKNSDVIAFYENNTVHGFITTTATEGGNPVSIQEALSFGVPVIGTKVSDIPYMVEGNGILLSENPTPREIADAVETMCRMDERSYREWREKAYQKFLTSYDADRLHPEMVEELLNL
jgi:glycosyltransferase involved in cell wall biosynthesis